MNLKQALQRIEELERKVKELEARPRQQIHYHYTQPPYVQPPYVPETNVQPWKPYIVYCAHENTAGTQWSAAQAK